MSLEPASRTLIWVLATLGCLPAIGQSCPGILPSFEWASEGNAVRFVNTTADPYGLVDSLTWDLGDTLVQDQDTVYRVYPTTTTHVVSLFAWASYGPCAYSISALVAHGDMNDLCTASIQPSFSWYQPSNNAVAFTNTSSSTGAALVSGWMFGDGSPLLVTNDTLHSYAIPGQYTVVLTSAGQDSVTLDGCVAGVASTLLVDGNSSTCDSSLFVDILLSPISETAIQADGMVLINDPDLSVDHTSWSFGDQGVLVIDESSAIHDFLYPGIYQVCFHVQANDTVTSDSCSVIVCKTFTGAPLAVEELVVVPPVRLWPVPFTNEVNILLERWNGEPWSVSLFDPSGRVVIHKFDISGPALSLGGGALAPGVYVLNISGGGAFHRGIVVKQ